MRWSVLLFVVVGCQQGGPKQQPAPAPAPVRAIDAAAPIDAPAISDAYTATIDESLHRIEAGGKPLHVCFAVSSNHRRVACISQSAASDADGPSNIVILGDVGEATSQWQTYDISSVREALAQRKYVAFDAHGSDLVKTATVGNFKVRRERKITKRAVAPRPHQHPGDADFSEGSWNEYSDSIEVACGAQWVDAHLDGLLNMRYGDEIGMRVSAFDDHHVLLEVDGTWAIEGEHGSILAAQLFDVSAVCALAPGPTRRQE